VASTDLPSGAIDSGRLAGAPGLGALLVRVATGDSTSACIGFPIVESDRFTARARHHLRHHGR
jgi:hypothetical protein